MPLTAAFPAFANPHCFQLLPSLLMAPLCLQAQAPTTYFKRLEELQLRPETLPDLLVDKLGFRLVKRLQPPSDAATGFDRPMFLFRKPA